MIKLEIVVAIVVLLIVGADSREFDQRRESTNSFGEHQVNKLVDLLHAQKGRMYQNVVNTNFDYNFTEDTSRQDRGRGKGKGKGSDIVKKSKSGKSSKQKCKPDPDESPSGKGKGKGSGSKGGKSSKGSHIECNVTETMYPSSTIMPTLGESA
jgi:hypothetical protein